MRRTKRVKITTHNRDHGKEFELTEMSADDAERWALRAGLALTNTGAAVPEEALRAAPMAAFAAVAVNALGLLKFEQVYPLLQEVWPLCVRICPPDGRLMPRELMPGSNDVEEVTTRFLIYRELLELHTGFSLPGAPPTSDPQQEPGAASSWLTSISRALSRMLWSHS